ADDNALNFLLKYRNEIFGEIPVIFCGINNFNETEQQLKTHNKYTGIVESFDIKANFDLILKLHPYTEEIVVVSDQTTSGIANLKMVQQIIPEYENIKFRFINKGNLNYYQQELEKLIQGSVALVLPVTRDTEGNTFTYEESFEIFTRSTQIPIYSPWDMFMGMGVVGGIMISGEEQGRVAAKIALRIMKGQLVDNIPINRVSPNRYMFDYNQLNRFDIEEHLLPKGSIIINKNFLLQEFYKQYKTLIWTVILFVVMLVIILVMLVINIFKRIRAEKERQKTYEQLAKTNQAYSRFVPHNFLEFLGRKSIIDVKLGDQTQAELTILFSDIRSFTTLSENMTLVETFCFINDYLKKLGPIVRNCNGFVDKYIGDAIMALFSKSPADAIRAGILMQKAMLEFNSERMNKAKKFRDKTEFIVTGIGIHTGSLMLGMIGETERMEGTVISDAVNLASRLEGLTKIFGAGIAVSCSTLRSALEIIPENEINYRFLGSIVVKGKTNTINVFEVFDGDPNEIVELKQRTLEYYNQGLDYYFIKDFSNAIQSFAMVVAQNPNDKAAHFYQKRCTELEDNVAPDWNGVITFDIK
ncbi:ABC transporter substrate binding protein, partial [Candidatus Halobeggiatoa sp. HSG11]|nr:ABC transporter substrate binding protein [Candidatus Halobeggiatoa sp. HSG11]